jgi:hypothetical protein
MRTIDLNDDVYAVIRTAASEDAPRLFSHDGDKYKSVSSRWRNLSDGSAGGAGRTTMESHRD